MNFAVVVHLKKQNHRWIPSLSLEPLLVSWLFWKNPWAWWNKLQKVHLSAWIQLHERKTPWRWRRRLFLWKKWAELPPALSIRVARWPRLLWWSCFRIWAWEELQTWFQPHFQHCLPNIELVWSNSTSWKRKKWRKLWNKQRPVLVRVPSKALWLQLQVLDVRRVWKGLCFWWDRPIWQRSRWQK